MSKQLVLAMGANGFIASVAVKAFLDAGFNVRGTVRSARSGEAFQNVLAGFVKSGQLELAIVPDITKAGAFDIAVEGTKTLLNSAYEHEKSLRTVVLMSPIVVITSPREAGHIYTEKDWNESSEEAISNLGWKAASIDIYAASKTAAERTFGNFRHEKKPSWTMTATNPALVGGPPLLLPQDPKDINETVRDIYTILFGAPIPPTKGTGTMVDVRDIARLLVFAVEHPEKMDGERYLAASAAGHSQSVTDILRKVYPDRRSIIQEGTPGEGYASENSISECVDYSKAVKTTGVPFVGLEESVLAAAKAFEIFL